MTFLKNILKKCWFTEKIFHVKLNICCPPVNQCVEPVVAFAMPPWFAEIYTENKTWKKKDKGNEIKKPSLEQFFGKKYSNCLDFHVKLKICGPVSQCVEPVVAYAMPPWFPGILTVCLPLFWRRSQFSSPNNSSSYSNFTKFSNQNSQRMKTAYEWRETWWFVE